MTSVSGYCSGNPALSPIGCLSVLDTNHDFGKELKTNKYYRAFLQSHRKEHRPSPENVAETEFGMKIDTVIDFDTVNINDLYDTDHFCLSIRDINDEAFKSFLGAFIYQNEDSQRIDMITDTTNLSQNTLCSLRVGNVSGRSIVTEATYFDRGRFQQVDGSCVVEQSVPVSLLKEDQNMFQLDYIRTGAFSTGERRYGTIEYEDRRVNFAIQLPISTYILATPGKLPFYIRVIKNLHLGNLEKPTNLLQNLLKDLKNLYGIQGLPKEIMANTLFDLKRAGDQLQVKTAAKTHTLFATNDRITATYAKYLGLPTIRTTLEDQGGLHRHRKYYFYNFVGDRATYLEQVKHSMIQKIESILASIRNLTNISRIIQRQIFPNSIRNPQITNNILIFLLLVKRLRNLNATIIGRQSSQRVVFNENSFEIYRCLKLWEGAEYIANILYFLINPKVRSYQYPNTEYAIGYSDLLMNLETEYDALNRRSTTPLTDYKVFLQKIGMYHYAELFNLSSPNDFIAECVDTIRLLSVNDYRLIGDEDADKEFIKDIESVAESLMERFSGYIQGVREYREFITHFIGVPISVQLFGSGIRLTNYPTEFAKPVMINKYKGILEKIQTIEPIYKSMILTFSQSGGKSTSTVRNSVSKGVSVNSLWKHYTKQQKVVVRYESYYQEDAFTNHYLSKLRSLYTQNEPMDEMAELIFVFLVKMNLQRDRRDYYDTDEFLSRRMRSSIKRSRGSTPTAPRKASTIKISKRSTTPVRISKRSTTPVRISKRSTTPVRISKRSTTPVKVSRRSTTPVRVSRRSTTPVRISKRSTTPPRRTLNGLYNAV